MEASELIANIVLSRLIGLVMSDRAGETGFDFRAIQAAVSFSSPASGRGSRIVSQR